MNVEKLLTNYYKREQIYANILYGIQELKEKQALLRINQKAQVLTDMPRGGGTSDPTQRTVLKILDLQERIDDMEKRIKQFQETFHHLEVYLKDLTERQQEVLRLTYLHGLNDYKIAPELNISRQAITEHRNKALDALRYNLDEGGIYG